MIQHVPRGSSDIVPWQPAGAAPRPFLGDLSSRGRSQPLENGTPEITHFPHEIHPGWRLEAPPQSGEVRFLGANHVLHDLVQVASAASGAPAELPPPGILDRLIEGTPAGLEQLPIG